MSRLAFRMQEQVILSGLHVPILLMVMYPQKSGLMNDGVPFKKDFFLLLIK